MRLIHLSDIHFGGYGAGWDPDEDQRNELLFDIDRLVAAGGPVDGVLVGGDIAFQAASHEYERAATWLTEVARRGGCTSSQVWAVPGNHDLSRTWHYACRSRRAMVDVLRSTDLTRLDVELVHWFSDPAADILIGGCFEQYNLFAEQWGCQTSASQPHWTDLTLGGLDGLDVCLTGLNSVLFSDTNDDPRDGPILHLGRRQCELQRASHRVHIAFGHHPPGWLRDWEQVEPYLRRAHLLLFGHEHKFGARQRDPGGTVEVFAGAVGPDRTGAPDESYAPSWNMISIERNGEDLAVAIDQRVWFKARTCFDTYPDGDAKFTVRIDLSDATEATDGRPDEGGEHPGTNSTPLIPDATEVREGVSLPSPLERTKLREVAVQFMRLAPTRRMQIADDLGVSAGLLDQSYEQGEVAREILRRVRAANRTEEFISLLSNG